MLKHAGWDLGTALLTVIVIAIGQSLIIGLLSLRVSGVYFAMVMAIRDNETRAKVLGYHTLTFKLIAITVSGVMAALAGAFNALWNLNANPAVLGVGTTINALLMTIIGGVGSLIGSMLGAGVIQLLGYWLNVFFGPSWPLLFGIVYLLIVLFLPYGIIGTWRLRGPHR
ncbi:branched-chain amino acid ABC transporter permease [Chloroflexus sp.]|uniref:branched-chain amino acid ABC transporter permease n=1 Tax=Chloroflexus sp. TaxID=1904827 RepID=UPI003C792FCA